MPMTLSYQISPEDKNNGYIVCRQTLAKWSDGQWVKNPNSWLLLDQKYYLKDGAVQSYTFQHSDSKK
jgi:hypothetical protein